MTGIDIERWKSICIPHGLAYSLLTMIILCLFILTIVYGTLWRNNRVSFNEVYPPYAIEKCIIGFPPLLPDDGRYIQWTFLQMNDVYELLPLDQGRKGGLARVAYLRKLLLDENNATITVLAGDLVSPSAIGTARINGTALNGKQMIATMNTLGLDYLVFGNHEFDISETDLLSRMSESTFTWLGTNVFRKNSSEPFGTSLTHKIITISTVRILLIGLTVDRESSYARFSNQSSLIDFTKQFLRKFSNGSYDVLVALTHLEIAADVELAKNIPEIDLIIGGHEHENYYYVRGTADTSIYKADANTATVYIHRCAFNLDTKQFRIYSTLAPLSANVPEEEKTAAAANYWFNLGISVFLTLGYQPSRVVSCLPTEIQLDGRGDIVKTSQNLFTDIICQSMISATASNQPTVAVLNSGSIRIDDVLRGTLTEYDIMRTLPFGDSIFVLSVPGSILAQALTESLSMKGTGIYLSYTGLQTFDGGVTWISNGSNIALNGLNYTTATLDYARRNTALRSNNVTMIGQSNVTQTKALIDFLRIKYPPC